MLELKAVRYRFIKGDFVPSSVIRRVFLESQSVASAPLCRRIAHRRPRSVSGGAARMAGVVTGVGRETNGSPMMRILVTGAGGLLGSELSGALAERGHAVVAMLYSSTAMHRNDGRPLYARPWDGTLPPPGEIAALRGDVRQPGLGLDGTSLAEIVRDLDLVIHAAAATGFNLGEQVY